MSGYQIKATIENTKPPVWRRLVIPDRITFRDLHGILQKVFGWSDMHMHDFTFQNTRVSVGGDEESDFDEAGLLTDDFLRAGWIRYTYDFGDDWRHKIVLEKELPDYAERYSQVVKYKGDNFVEDSGGAWDESSLDDKSRQPFDLEAVNARLASLACPVDPQAVTAENQGIWVTEKKELKEKRDKLLEAIADAADLAREALGIGTPATIDLLAQKLENDWYDLEDGGCWDLRDSDKSMAEILKKDGLSHLFELHKYLSIPEDIKAPLARSMAERVAESLKEHPEYLVYIFTPPELRMYIDCFRGRKPAQLPQSYMIMAFAMWGLAELEFVQKKKKPYLYIGLPKDAESIVAFHETAKLGDQQRRIEREWERIEGLIMCYGFMEVQSLYEQYVRVFGEISMEELERCLYLRGSFRQEIVTGNVRKGEYKVNWAALYEDIAVAVTGWTEKESEEPEKSEGKICRMSLPYKEFTKKQVLEIKRKGYSSVYPQWQDLREVLEHVGYEDWEMDALLDAWYEQVQCGDGMKSLLEEFEGAEDWLDLEDMVLLEHTLCRCWAETGIPYLKGHSRQEIAEKTGKSLFAVASDDGYVLPGYTETHLNKQPGTEGSGQAEPKIDPDAFCPCGSGKRYRQCCGRKKR